MRDQQQNRSAVLLEFGFLWDKMADEIVRLRRILAALREPSKAAMRAGNRHMLAMYRGEKKGRKYKIPLWGVISDILPAAVEAAEQEADA